MITNPKQPLEFVRWIDRADRLFRCHYAVSIKDIGPSDSDLLEIWKSGETSADYVQRIGQKYDLVGCSKWLARTTP